MNATYHRLLKTMRVNRITLRNKRFARPCQLSQTAGISDIFEYLRIGLYEGDVWMAVSDDGIAHIGSQSYKCYSFNDLGLPPMNSERIKKLIEISCKRFYRAGGSESDKSPTFPCLVNPLGNMSKDNFLGDAIRKYGKKRR